MPMHCFFLTNLVHSQSVSDVILQLKYRGRSVLNKSVDKRNQINYLYIKIFNLNESDSKVDSRIYSNKYLQLIDRRRDPDDDSNIDTN